MIQKRALLGILLAAALLGMVPALSIATPAMSPPGQEEPPELLQNPGFEGLVCESGSVSPECLGNWSNSANHDGSFHDNIFTPQGWTTWWREGDGFGQPEVKTIPSVPPFTGDLPRIRSGYYAVLLFTYHRLQNTGLYQCVSGLEPGSTVKLRAYAHGWSCEDDTHKMGYSCGDPFNQTFQVGIEPNGIADPFAPSVVWSAEKWIPDHYGKVGPVSVQVGEGGTVCAILRSTTKWMYKYQDAYWDDASLKMTAPGTPPTNTPPPPPPPATVGPPPTPLATSTPHPDGSVIHTVQPNDTLFGIALMYGVELDQIRQLNASALGDNNIIHIGQDLVISLPSAAPTLTPLPPPEQPTPTESASSNPGDSAPGETGGASICALAFHDRDSNSFRDATTEELLPNATFTLASASGVIAQYLSDGINEPHCFTELATGAYRVIQAPPPGYAPSGSAERDIAVGEGTRLDISFGNVRDENAIDTGEDAETAAGDENGSQANGSPSIFSTLAKVSGVLVLILAAGTAVLFVISRQRMM